MTRHSPSLPLNSLLHALRRCYAPVSVACLATGLMMETARALPSPFELSMLDGVNGFAMNGRGSDRAARAVGDAGDVNGDGVADFIIGGESNRSWVIFGRSAGGFPATLALSALNGSNGFALQGGAGDLAGYSVGAAGDVNGDGLDDLIIGAPFNDSNGLDTGRSYIVFGRSNGFPAVLDLPLTDATTGLIINGVDALDQAGYAVGGAGDVNGDGIDDLIIGAPNADRQTNLNTGQGYVVFGRSSGLPAILELSQLDGGNGFVIDGISAGMNTGSSVSSAGDVNGDGIGDLIIGAPGSDVTGFRSGQSFVIFGRSENFPALLALSAVESGSDFGFAINGGDTFERSGFSVRGAGDVNGDNLDDLIIGAPFAVQNGNTDTGKSYVVFGSSQQPAGAVELSLLDGSTGFSLNGVGIFDRTGFSVDGAGDINADGIDDLIIGVPGSGTGSIAGRSYVVFGRSQGFPAELELTSLTAAVSGFVIDGINIDDRAGYSVSGTGDINGDAIDDLIIGAYAAGATGPDAGQGYVVFGRSQGFPDVLALSALTGSDGFVVSGQASSESAAYSVSDAGDINGDGIGDIIVGADRADVNGANSGRSYVVFGHGGVGAGAVTLASLDGSNGFAINGITAGDRAGNAVSAAGDMNGDGIGDLIIGTRFADPAGPNSGQAYVIFGNTGPFATALELSALDGSNGFTINGLQSDNRTGNAVSGAGDINGDGLDDVIIGAYYAEPNGSNSGQAYLIFGRTGAFPATLMLSSLDGSSGFTIDGVRPGDRTGSSVSGAGDVNGDTLDDLIIGARSANANGYASGRSYVMFGRSTGFPPVLELSALGSDSGLIINGIESEDYAGAAVSGAGDVNGDGLDDLIIGAYSADSTSGGDNAGQAYVVFGQGQGSTSPLELSALDGSNGFGINGAAPADEAGRSVSGAGDINGDGLDDLVIGAPYADVNGSYSGQSYVLFGHTGEFAALLNLSALTGNDGIIINGIGTDNLLGRSVSAAGDVNADGIDDLVIGAPGADGNGNGSGQGYIVFGTRANLNLTVINDPGAVALNAPVSYTITVTNQGPTYTSGVRIEFTFPGALTFNSSAPDDWSCSGLTQKITCMLNGELLANDSATLTLTFTARQVAQIMHGISVSSFDFDPQLNNNVTTVTTTIITPANEIFEDQFE